MDPFLLAFGLMTIGASVIALLARWLKQPAILGYVVAGFLLGPVTGLLIDDGPITVLSELGLIFLLFVIGLELDLSRLKDVAAKSALVGLFQVSLVTLLIMTLSIGLGLTLLQGVYLGLIVSFSSTIVVAKILAEKRQLTSLYGELTLGITVAQDIIAVLALTLLGVFKDAAATPVAFPSIDKVLGVLGVTLPVTWWMIVGQLLVDALLFALLLWFLFRYVAPALFRLASSSSELLFITSLAAVFIVAALAGFFKFSFAIGAFATGIALSSMTANEEVLGRVKPIKEFFLILFFVGFGAQLSFADFGSQLGLLLLLLGGALLVKPIITYALLRTVRYSGRTSFFAGLNHAQLGEFGLVLASSGVLLGALTDEMLGTVAIAAVLTMTLTTYTARYDEALSRAFRLLLAPIDFFFAATQEETNDVPKAYEPEVVIFGLSPVTSEAALKLSAKRKVLVVDPDPSKLKPLRSLRIPTICSDATNYELWDMITFAKAELVISILSEPAPGVLAQSVNLTLIRRVRAANKDATIVILAQTPEWGRRLALQGADVILTSDLVLRQTLTALLTRELEEIRREGKRYRKELFHSSAIDRA